MNTLPFEKMYVDEPDEWADIAEDEMRAQLEGYYLNIDIVIDAIREGQIIRTPWAFFRIQPEPEKP